MKEEDFLGVNEVADILNVPCDTVYDWVTQGVLNPVSQEKPPVFHPKEIQTLAEKNHAPAATVKRILIVEDDELVGESLVNLFKKEGFDAFWVPLGIAALDLACRQSFDLAIMDVRMPGMNGIDTLKAIRDLRQRIGKPVVPEIILTAYDDESVRTEARRIGVLEFLLKPFDMHELLAVIRGHLNSPSSQRRQV